MFLCDAHGMYALYPCTMPVLYLPSKIGAKSVHYTGQIWSVKSFLKSDETFRGKAPQESCATCECAVGAGAGVLW